MHTLPGLTYSTNSRSYYVYTKGRWILSACALLSTEHALATGMDCTKAVSTVEKSICANTALYALDSQMGAAYRALVKASSEQQVELRTAQRAWLKSRDRCVEDVACLDQRYRERLQELRAQWSDAVAYRPDDVDRLASEDLRQAIEKSDPEFPLERVLDSLAVKAGTTGFASEGADDEPHLPKTAPAGVTKDEWKALTASKINGEYGNRSYTLMDLDGDGLRDLVVDTYTGGTGLFEYIETFRRSGDVFVKRVAGPGSETNSEADSESFLFSLNGRGANQTVTWVKVRGRIYAAYQNSYYGVDHVYLLNPLKLNSDVPTISVNYRYELSVPKTQKDEETGVVTTLDAALHTALTQALSEVSKTEAKDVGDQSRPLCPIPPTGEGDGAYSSYGTGHYTFEIVGDMPITLGGDCYIGRLMDWFGGYNAKDGLYAQLLMRKPESVDGGRGYQVNGRRSMTGVTTSVGKVEGDNGM